MIFGQADLSKEIYVKLIQQKNLSAKLWQAISAINEAKHTATEGHISNKD